MAEHALPGLGILGGWPNGANNIDTQLNGNWQKLSATAQMRVIGRVASLPGSPVQGDMYILNSDKKIYIRDDGAWVSFTPGNGWRAFDDTTDKFIYYNGTTWVDELPTVSASGMDLLAVATASNSAFLEFDNSVINSSYDVYRAELRGIAHAAASSLMARFYVGGSLITSGYYYLMSTLTSGVTSPAVAYSASSADAIPLIQYPGIPANSGVVGNFVFSGKTGRSKLGYYQCGYSPQAFGTGTNAATHRTGHGACPNSGQLDGLRLYMSTGNISEGQVYLYGMKSNL